MKNLKKFLAVIITVAMLATMMIPAFAEEEISADAKTCANLGLLAGDGAGVTAEYLAKGTERIQAAIIMLRLLGKIDEAVEFDYTENFDDADKVWQGGKNIMGYLKANPEYGWVGDAGNFKPTDKASAKEIYKVILNVLGYETGEGKDFAWNDTIDFAAEKGLKAIGDLESLTNDDVAAAIVEGLKANLKTGNMTLVEDLVAKKIVSEKVAQDEGLIAKELKVTLAATGAKKLTVSFNQAVDTEKVKFAVKKGSFAVNVKEVTFAEDKKSATLELASKLTEGEYSVTVSGLTETAIVVKTTAANEKIVKIEFTSDKAVLVRNGAGVVDGKKVNVGYKVYNQYNEDITDANKALTFTASKADSKIQSKGTLTLEVTGSGVTYAKDEKITVTALDIDSTTYASQVFTVADKATVDEITIKEIWNSDKKVAKDGENGSDYFLLVSAKDQYGNDVPAANIAADVWVTSLNPTVVPSFSNPVTVVTKNDSPAIALPGTLKAGTSTIKIVSLTTGKSASFDVVVKEKVKVDSLTLSVPEPAVAGEDVEIPFTAIDQFGNEVTDANDLTVGANNAIASLVASTGTLTFDQDVVKDVAKLKLSGVAEKGMVTITGVTGTGKPITMLTINFVDPAEPTVVVGVKDVAKAYVNNAANDINAGDNIIVNDQYGREYDITEKFASYRLVVNTSDKEKVSVAGDVYNGDDYYINSKTSKVTLKGDDKGSATITISLEGKDDKGNWKAVDNSAYTFTAKTVEKADISSYEIADMGKVYDGQYDDRTSDYDVDLKVNGVLADGTKVALPTDDAAYYEVVKPTGANVNYTTGKVSASKGGSYDDGKSDRTVSFVVVVKGDKGSVVLTKEVVVSKAKPEITSLYLEKATGFEIADEASNLVKASASSLNSSTKINAAIATVLKAKDQYGVVIPVGTTTNIISKITDNKAISEVAARDKIDVTVVTSNGKTFVIKFVAE